jgi:hypothetical protein
MLMAYQSAMHDNDRWAGDSALNNSLDYKVLAVEEGVFDLVDRGGNPTIKGFKGYKLTIEEVAFPREKPSVFYIPSGKLPQQVIDIYNELDRISDEISRATYGQYKRELMMTYSSVNTQVENILLTEDLPNLNKPKKYRNGNVIKDYQGNTVYENLRDKSIDYGYAHTIHKSQGGTYQTVFVQDKNISRAGKKINGIWKANHDTQD